MPSSRHKSSRVPSRHVPRFRGTRDLKFSAAEQAAIRHAEAAFGYRSQPIPVAPHVALGLARFLSIAFAIWLVVSVVLGIGRFIGRDLISTTKVQSPPRPSSARVGHPAPPSNHVQAAASLSTTKPPGSDGSALQERGVAPYSIEGGRIAAEPQPVFTSTRVTQPDPADLQATATHETLPLCPPGRSHIVVSITDTPYGRVFKMSSCRRVPLRESKQPTLQIISPERVAEVPAVQWHREITESQPVLSEAVPPVSSVVEDQVWESFSPQQPDPSSHVPQRTKSGFQIQPSFSSWPAHRPARKQSFMRRMLGGVGHVLLGVGQVVAMPVEGQVQVFQPQWQILPYTAQDWAERRNR